MLPAPTYRTTALRAVLGAWRRPVAAAHRRAAVAHEAQLDQLLGDPVRLSALQGVRHLVDEQLGEAATSAVHEIGRASCRERVEMSVVAVSVHPKTSWTR